MSEPDLDTGTRPDVSGDGAAAPAGVTPPDGGGNGQPEAPPADPNAELAALRAKVEAFEMFISRMGVAEPDAGQHPPTPDNGRTPEQDEDSAILEAEIAALARSKDPLARMLVAEKRERLRERQLYGNAIAALNEKMEIAALPEATRDDFRNWLRRERHNYANFDAARLAYKGYRSENPLPGAPSTTASGKTPPAPAPRPRLVMDVDAHARPMPAREAAERIMTDQQYDDLLTKLHSEGDHEGARALARKYADGEIVIK
jgi:hypothetical protein